MKFKSDIEVQAGIKDSSGNAGTSGQVLSSNGGTVAWTDVNTTAETVQNQVKAGEAINKGQAVYVTSADGTNIIVGLASNTSEGTSSKTLGLLNATVAINGMADVVQIGRLAGIDTSTAIVGDPVWLGANGNLIYGLANKPYAPLHLVYIGVVTRVNANNGEIFVTVQNGFELDELHNVAAQNPTDGDTLKYISSTGLWTACAAPSSIIVLGSGTCSTQRIGVSNNASGNCSVSLGGANNTASGTFSFIGGGNYNCANPGYLTPSFAVGYTVVVGGKNNSANGAHSFVGSGVFNIAGGTNSFVGGGCQNTAAVGPGFPADYGHTTVVGGRSNQASGGYSSIVGGKNNITSGVGSFIGGGKNNNICNTTLSNDVIVGGNYNCICNYTADSSNDNGNNFIGGGGGNKIICGDTQGNSIVGGFANTVQGPYSSGSIIAGGINNRIGCVGAGCGINSGIIAGSANTINGSGSFIGAGCLNLSNGPNNFIGSGRYNNVTAERGSIVGGECNLVCNGIFSIIGSGYANTICNSKYSVIGGGGGSIYSEGTLFKNGNTITDSCNASILGGCLNGIGYNSTYSSIGGGVGNGIGCVGCYTFGSTIGGGAFNKIKCFHSVISGGCSNRIYANNSTIAGGRSNTILFTGPSGFIGGGNNNCIWNSASYSSVVGGRTNRACAAFSAILGGCNNTVNHARSFISGSGLTSSATYTTFVNALSKTSGTFRINHPDPTKTETHYLQHSFVESPTGGDNIYRFTITTINGIGTIVLPDYYKFLNKEDQIWVTAKNHFGLAYGIINEEQTEITINSDVDGEYNVLLIGTRKDIDALDGWQGVEIWK